MTAAQAIPAVLIIDTYPTHVIAGHTSTLCLDIGLLRDDDAIRAVELDPSPLGANCEFLPYTNAQGQKSAVVCMTLKDDLRPGNYQIALTAITTTGERAAGITTITVSPQVVRSHPPRIIATETKRSEEFPLRPGNRIAVLDHGPTAFQEVLKTLESARHTIHLQTYYLDDNGMCAEVIDLLKRKAAQGVEVDLIITRYSQLGKSPITYLDLKRNGVHVLLVGDIGFPQKVTRDSTPWYARMREEYRIFKSLPRETPFRQWFEENVDKDEDLRVDYALHEKMLIVDGVKAIVGGRNISDCYYFWWRDLDVLLMGPIVQDLETAFQDNWHEFSGPELRPLGPPPTAFRDGIPMQLTQSEPWSGAYTTLDMLCSAIDQARQRVYITSQYLALPPKLTQALSDAAARGVDVRILTNSLDTGKEVNLSLCHFISLNYYRDLLKAGIGVYEYQCPPDKDLRPYYHAKQFIIDGRWLSIGSFNLSIRSAYLESELMITIHDESLAQDRERQFLDDLNRHAARIDLNDYAREEDTYRLLMEMARHLEILY